MFQKMLKLLALSFALLSISCSHHHYKKYDSNGDGKITKSEWKKSHDMKFEKLDKDGDGVISEAEYGGSKKKKCKAGCKKSCCAKKCDGKSCSTKKMSSCCTGKTSKKCDGKSCEV